jgi:hypothetical protein
MAEQQKTVIDQIINAYDKLIRGIDKEARGAESRAYGGIIRAGKGKLVENIAKNLVSLAWSSIGGAEERISFETKRIKIPLKKGFIEKIDVPEVRDYIKRHIKKYYYGLKTDLHVFIDNIFVLAVECKAYTENAMFKRILVDFTLLKTIFPTLKFVLLQLESQLGGDYSNLTEPTYGSRPTLTLLSYFDIDLNIITLLKGERKVDKPIHVNGYQKQLTEESLINALSIFQNILKKQISS